ncbi:MAG TPA: hypothetical protein VGC84_06980 [Ilumatobacteraceae bacterium]|jgi:hypothetical protein
MGEKGIGGAVEMAANMPGANSVIEKTTTSVVTSVTGVGADLMTTVQEKAIGAVADEAIEAARKRMSGEEASAATESTPEEPR